MIRLLVLDVDGVLTDGRVLLSADGSEQKTLFFRDIDAVFAARKAGVEVALVTGEGTPIVDVIARRLGVERVLSGRKDKLRALEELATACGIALDECCYVGDAVRDVPAISAAGLGLAPADASAAARTAADRVLSAPGGYGAVEEVVEIVLAGQA